MKKILFVTASRSEFGILKNIILSTSNSSNFKSKLLVTGTHLNSKFGYTKNEINKSNINRVISIKIKMGKTSGTNSCNIASEMIKKIGALLSKNQPDSVVLFGDRFEILAIAYACFLQKIPIMHIGGGETTEGSNDESIRHAVSKLASFHFVSHKIHKERLLQMGENKKRVFIIGSPGIENIRKIKLMSKSNLEKELKIKFLKNNFVVNFYPLTNHIGKEKKHIKILLKALKKFKSARIIFTLPAFDIGSDIIINEIKKYVKNNKNSYFYKSLGSLKYLSLLKYSNLILGNSSSGLIEAPIIGTKVINIGDRQKGRIKPKEVINIKCVEKDIVRSIKYALRKKILYKNIYPKINSSKKFTQILKSLKFENVLIKKFIDFK